jgi:RNA polymerase sigma factor (sigma-70 family)
MTAFDHSSEGVSISTWPDERLITACLNGDSEAWSALVSKYDRLIFSIPIKLGLSRDDASDIFQQVCFGLVSELARLRDPKSLPAWLIKVTSSRCFELMRQHGRHKALSEAQGSWLAETRTAEHLLHECEREQMIREAIQATRPRCRELIEMLFFESPPLSYEETAKRLKIATGSVGFIRMRCLRKLRKALEEKGF